MGGPSEITYGSKGRHLESWVRKITSARMRAKTKKGPFDLNRRGLLK